LRYRKEIKMDDKMIPAQGGLYTPEELASAYAERGERIEELLRGIIAALMLALPNLRRLPPP
jgi:hypothetical protein